MAERVRGLLSAGVRSVGVWCGGQQQELQGVRVG